MATLLVLVGCLCIGGCAHGEGGCVSDVCGCASAMEVCDGAIGKLTCHNVVSLWGWTYNNVEHCNLILKFRPMSALYNPIHMLYTNDCSCTKDKLW